MSQQLQAFSQFALVTFALFAALLLFLDRSVHRWTPEDFIQAKKNHFVSECRSLGMSEQNVRGMGKEAGMAYLEQLKQECLARYRSDLVGGPVSGL